MLNLIPTTYGRFAFGIGGILLLIFAALYVIGSWEKVLRGIQTEIARPDRVLSVDVARRCFKPLCLTILLIMAPILLLLGPTLGSPGPDLHAVQPVRQDFIDALHKAEEAVRPQTKQERQVERELKQEDKRAAETEVIEDRDERVLEGVESFRARMLNPDIQE